MRESQASHSERLMAMGQMMAGFAHEFRNPLAALQSILEGLLADPLAGDSKRDELLRMQRIVQRMNRLVRSSLHFGQPSTPHVGVHPPLTLVRSAIELLGPRLQEAPGPCSSRERERGPLRTCTGPIVVSVPGAAPDVHVDDGQIVQTLVILLDNALDATQDAAKVRVVVTPLSNGARIEVVDAGAGIAPELAGRIFAPFFTTKPKGTGLGLSIARKLVEENHGHLTVASEPGRTTFTMDLPGESP